MDLYADPPGTRVQDAGRFTAALGGSSANIAVALVRQGCRAALVSTLSDDAVGEFCLAELDRYGVDRAHVRLVGGQVRTSLAVVDTRGADTQSVIYRNDAADFALMGADVDAVDWAAFSAVIATGTALAADPSRSAVFRAFAAARGAGVPVILDLDYRPYSWGSRAEAAEVCARAAALSDIVVGNDVEFGVLSGDPAGGLDAARALVAGGVRVAVYKMGEAGAVTLAPAGEFATGIFRTAALKPTGAGDAFMGGFVAGLSAGQGLRDAVLRGSAAAAMVVARVGCAPAMPTAGELDAFLATHPAP
jgi:5-dehydro-2-deoxygluconokinase